MLGELLRRIMRQEGRHIDFYATQAAPAPRGERAAPSTSTRRALRHLWGPVGVGRDARRRDRHLIGHLFGGADGQAVAARIDRRVDRLPGLDGLDLVSRARDRVVGSLAA